ncbi:hypothetical protein ACFX1S_014355 [Malus domestica]
MRITDFQQLTDMYVSEISMFQDDHKMLLAEEYEEGYDLGYLTSYAWRNYPKGCDAYKIYDEKKHMDVPPSQHLLNEISDLEAKQEESNPKDDLASDTHVESSVLSKGKEITNGD